MGPSSWVMASVLVCLTSLTGCDRPSTAERTANLVRDTATTAGADLSAEDVLISNQVKAALLAAQDVNGTDISVSTKRGLVTLSGTVPARQVLRAAEVARTVDGVRSVDNRLKPVGVLS